MLILEIPRGKEKGRCSCLCCNPSSAEAGQVGPWDSLNSQLRLSGGLQAGERPVFTKQGEGLINTGTQVLWPQQAHVCIYLYKICPQVCAHQDRENQLQPQITACKNLIEGEVKECRNKEKIPLTQSSTQAKLIADLW